MPPPATGRGTFHYPRLLQAPSNPAWDSAGDGAATASLGILCQGPPALTGKNFPPTADLTLLSVTVKPFPFGLGLCGQVLVAGGWLQVLLRFILVLIILLCYCW